MMRQILAISLFVCFSSILIADSYLIIPGYYYPVASHQYGELKTQLESSNMGSALGGDSSVQIVNIISAKRNFMPGKNYRILANVSINGQTKTVCFVTQSLPSQEQLTVTSAQVGFKTC